MTPFLYGKHPAFGDFISYGGTGALARGLDGWSQSVLPGLREKLGADWDRVWKAALPLRFWLGPDVLGAPLQGIWLASRDRVGRSYPLVVGITDVLLPPPVDPRHDETFYDTLWQHIVTKASPHMCGISKASDMVEGFACDLTSVLDWEEGMDATIWGHRPDGRLSRLFEDARGIDAERAQFGRSHWWHPSVRQRVPGWLATGGLPDLAALEWLLLSGADVAATGETSEGGAK